MEYGRDYDFNKPFFEQIKKLFQEIPQPSSFLKNVVNVTYASYVDSAKNVYLSSSVVYSSEDVYYSTNIDSSAMIFDSFGLKKSEKCYQNTQGDRNYNCQYLDSCRECLDSHFLFNCVNCKNCLLSTNLRNKQYYIKNKPYSKKEYFDYLKNIDFGKYQTQQDLIKEFASIKLKAIHKYANVIKSVNVTGDNIANSKNSHNVFDGYDFENVKYAYRSLGLRDSMDVTHGASSSLFYEFMTGGAEDSYLVRFATNCSAGLHDTYYTNFCRSSSNLFGCMALNNKKHCILNKQYSEKEYEQMIEKIKKHMDEMPYVDKQGRTYKYGEFFPMELCPFAYNESIVQDFFPLTKEQALKQGYAWRKKPKLEYKPTLKAEDLPDNIKDAKDDILKEVIECGNKNCSSSGVFKIIPQELKFYRKQSIPLPRLCPDCRYRERMKKKNPWKLWHRKCMKKGCDTEFETSYAPDRPEIVYCEKCYNKEVG